MVVIFGFDIVDGLGTDDEAILLARVDGVLAWGQPRDLLSELGELPFLAGVAFGSFAELGFARAA